ncbi:MAG: hypothetical protein PSV22_12095 [Pseudolabrys sp.]|nr:hypothetical protein [Pseudolabrys sp.]
MDTPLSPEDERDILCILEGIDDPDVRRVEEKRARAHFQRGANAGSLSRSIFREELEKATALGVPNPANLAQTQTAHRINIITLEARTARALRASKSDILKFANKAAKKVERASKTTNKSNRRWLQADRDFLAAIGSAEKRGDPVPGSLVGAQIQSANPGYRLPHWDKTTLPLKVLACSIESAKAGAHTINLRLSDDVERAAREAPRGLARYMQARIKVALKAAFADDVPDFWFVIERDNATRCHLHGAVVLPRLGTEAMIDAALRKAGGPWALKIFQQKGLPLSKPLGWADYVVKTVNLTKIDFDGGLFASSAGIARTARLNWDDTRRALQES